MGSAGYLQDSQSQAHAVRDGLTFGRGSNCDLVVHDSKASRRHARIVVEAGVVEIEDLESSNGTLLNGKPVTRRVLRDGDQVQIGQVVFTYREGPPPGSAPPPAPAPAPAAMPARVVEFADEVVEVKPREPAKPGASPAPAPSAPIQRQPRILQFSKKAAKAGPLGDDLAQVGGGAKWLLVLLVLGAGVGIAYGIIAAMR